LEVEVDCDGFSVVKVVRECVGGGGKVLGDEEGDAAAAGGINFRVPLIGVKF
jgi:hypothetical protein